MTSPQSRTLRQSALSIVLACLIAAGAIGLETVTRAGATPASQRPLATWLPYWDGSAGLDRVLAHASRFRYVSPFWYQTSGVGTFTVNSGGGNPAWVQKLHAQGIAVVPTVTSGWGPRDASLIFNSPADRREHVDALVQLVTSHGYDGIDLDYEQMAATTQVAVSQRVRTGFNAFVAELCGRLRALHKRCDVTVMAETEDAHSFGGLDKWVWDYATLGRQASRVRLMVYDQHGPWSAPGPVAAADWTEDVLRYATSAIAPSKVELAVPTYGYDWSNGSAKAVLWDAADRLRRAHHAAVRFDAASQEPTFTYRAGGVAHTVWFENARSLAVKAALAQRFHVGTLGFWYIGHESPADWAVLDTLKL